MHERNGELDRWQIADGEQIPSRTDLPLDYATKQGVYAWAPLGAR